MSGASAKKLRKQIVQQAVKQSVGPLHLKVETLATGQVAVAFGRATTGFRVSAAEAKKFGSELVKHALEAEAGTLSRWGRAWSWLRGGG